MKVKMPCGRGDIEFDIPAEFEEKVTLWRSRDAEIIDKPHEKLEQALASPLGAPPLEELAKGRKTACVVISDKTRPVPNKLILPPLLAKLEKAGIARDDITILIANGMHDPTIGDALIELLGPEIISAYRIVNHDCQDKNTLREISQAGGYSIEINHIYLEAGLKVLTGLIEPHHFAGYSGGGKSILPGISGLDTMRYMHSFNLLDQESVAAARLADNPFHQMVMQTANTAGVDFVVNVLQDQERRLSGIFAGNLEQVFQVGAELAEKSSIIHSPEPGELVVTSAGGYPLDATLYQSSKGLMTAAQMLKPGGNIIWIAGCENGAGGAEFQEMAAGCRDYQDFKAKYQDPENFTIDQWGAQAYFKAMQKAGKVWLYSPGMNYVEARKFKLAKVESLNALFAGLASTSQSIHLLPEGPYMACKS